MDQQAQKWITRAGFLLIAACGLLWYHSRVRISTSYESLKLTELNDDIVRERLNLAITNNGYRTVRFVAVAPFC